MIHVKVGIIIIISLFNVDFRITFHNYKKPINVNQKIVRSKKGNIEGRKCCCDRSKNNNERSKHGIEIRDNAIQLDGEWIKQEWKPTWKRVKIALQKGTKQMRIETYQPKDQQSRFFREQEDECHLWLTQNLQSRKTSSIMSIMEQMVERHLSCQLWNRWWKRDLGRRPED